MGDDARGPGPGLIELLRVSKIARIRPFTATIGANTSKKSGKRPEGGQPPLRESCPSGRAPNSATS